MRLVDLRPTLMGKRMYLDCPKCKDTSKRHRFVIRFGEGPGTWSRDVDSYETMTIKPSYQSEMPCRAHFSVTNGEIVP